MKIVSEENFNYLINSPTNNYLNISCYQSSSNSPNRKIEFDNEENNSPTQSPSTPCKYIDFQQNEQSSQNIINENIPSKNKIPQNSINLCNSETKISSANTQNEPLRIPEPKIQNIVSTAYFNCNLNLKQIALQEKNSSYNPSRFSRLIMRIKEPKTTALLFSNGKIVCLGAKTEEESKNACRKYGKILKQLGYNVSFKNFKIRNMVGSCSLNFKIPLGCLYVEMRRRFLRVYYEPEVFPGLIYYYMNSNNNDEQNDERANIVFLIFNSGNIVITGAKKREQIYESFQNVYPVLKKFQSI